MTALGDRTLTFGFYKEMGSDLWPDPEFRVTLGDSEAELYSMVALTLLGPVYEKHGDGVSSYCAEFLEEMVNRKQRGIMWLNDRVTYP